MKKKPAEKKSIGGYSVRSIMDAQQGKGRPELYVRTPEEEEAYARAIADYNRDPSNLEYRQRLLETMNP